MKKSTQFAPAQRASASSIKKDFNILNDSQYIKTVIDAIPEVVAILNEQRQIVFGNEALLKFLGIVDKETLLGLRPGEAVHCINSGLTEGGCGTSEKCRYCGAVNSILESQRLQQSVTKECRITANKKWEKRIFRFKGHIFSV
jgi:PAS domain-containing protein